MRLRSFCLRSFEDLCEHSFQVLLIVTSDLSNAISWALSMVGCLGKFHYHLIEIKSLVLKWNAGCFWSANDVVDIWAKKGVLYEDSSVSLTMHFVLSFLFLMLVCRV